MIENKGNRSAIRQEGKSELQRAGYLITSGGQLTSHNIAMEWQV